MTEREGIFAGDDPFKLVRDWLDSAAESEPTDPNAASLATVDMWGLPNVRVVLVKGFESDGFVFYTNYESAKGGELDGAGKAALGFHWKSLGRQIRMRGPIERVSPEQSDAYYRSRPLDSRLGAWASKQSRPLEDRETLMAAVEAARETHGEDPARPPHWGGYRLRPLEIEFWCNGAFRLHDRFQWKRANLGEAWTVNRLNP